MRPHARIAAACVPSCPTPLCPQLPPPSVSPAAPPPPVSQLPLDAFVITKQLTKAPKDYTDAKNQPHVLVAKQMIEQVCKGAVKGGCEWWRV